MSVCVVKILVIEEKVVVELLYYFFFQAEDGIRDGTVTGVQTCALPIFFLLWGSANRDPQEFADPDALIADRLPNRHMAFGVGIHRCLGAPLARLEIRVARSEEHTSELQSQFHLVCRLLLEKKKQKQNQN